MKVVVMNVYERLSLKQLDETLGSLRSMSAQSSGVKSWIKHIRKALGFSTYQLASRLGMTQSSLSEFESREVEAKITLDNLKKIAEAMGCDLIYAFVPKTSLQEFIAEQEQQLSDKILEKTHLTMSIENQGLNEEDLKRQKAIILQDIQSKPLKFLWSQNDL